MRGGRGRLKRMDGLRNLFPEKLTPESERSKVDQKRTEYSDTSAKLKLN